MHFPQHIQNQIIMYARPIYPYLPELNKYHITVEHVLYLFFEKPKIADVLGFL